MSKSKSQRQPEPETVSESSTETDTSGAYAMVSTKVKDSDSKDLGDLQAEAIEASKPATRASRGSAKKKGKLGLKIMPVPGGLYKVKNMDGGIPPAPMGALWNDLEKLQILVEEYNQKVN